MLDDLEPIPLKSIEERESIGRSKSIMALDSSIYGSKSKPIATSLYCVKCEKNYQPNEYYRHLRKCDEETKVMSQLLQKKENLEKQISAIKKKDFDGEVDRVVVLVKSQNRTSVTSRPKVR